MTRVLGATETVRSPATGAQSARDALLFLVEALGDGAYEANIDGRLAPDELKNINLFLSRLTTSVDALICKIYP